MAVKEISHITDHIEKGLSRVPEQFKLLEKKYNSPIKPELLSGWEAFLTAFIKPAQEFEDICHKMLDSYDLRFTTGNALDRLGELVGQVRAGRNDEEYRTAILIKIGANNSEGTYTDLVDLYEMFGLSVQSYLEPKPATFLFHLGPIAKETMESVKGVTEVAKAAGVGYEFTGVISDPSDPIDKDEPLFIFKNGGKGEHFATLLDDGTRSDYGGRWSLLLKSSVPPPPDLTHELAVGAIQMSLLDEATFATAMGADAVNWVLADGREVNGSKYTEITARETVPNMAGKFTRMAVANAEILEEQDPSINANDISFNLLVGGTSVNVGNYPISISSTRSNWFGATTTGYSNWDATWSIPYRTLNLNPPNQFGLGPDKILAISCATSDIYSTCSMALPHTYKPFNTGQLGTNKHSHANLNKNATVTCTGTMSGEERSTDTQESTIDLVTGTETRPTNMSVYYYIKIN